MEKYFQAEKQSQYQFCQTFHNQESDKPPKDYFKKQQQKPMELFSFAVCFLLFKCINLKASKEC